MDDITTRFRAFPCRYLERQWTPEDGLADVASSQPMPGSLRSFYRELGGCDELLEMYNEFVPAYELTVDAGYLVFVHENQDVVSWGFSPEDTESADPVVWQRNNEEHAWYSEEKTLAPFLESMFDWVVGAGDETKKD